MKALSLCLPFFLPTFSALAAGTITPITQSWSGILGIPDNDGVGASNTITLSVTGEAQIEIIEIQVEIEGGWNGDLYAYLVHDGKISVLLNRPGRTLLNAEGSASSGMNLLFSDNATSDVHVALPNSGTPVGSFQPDGRTTDPLAVLDTDARTAPLSVFGNQNANGAWTLFLADQGAGEVSTLKSWTLSVSLVPEPSTSILAGLSVIGLVLRRNRGVSSLQK